MVPSSNIDFIGIGAPKSGSTWIGKCLEEHPQILMSSKKTRKEIFYFNVDDVWGDNNTGRLSYYKNGLDWYLNQFPEPKEGHVRGEFSVSYMADPVAYERIYKDFPNTKIIAVLRNPTDMIYSLYWYFYNGAIQKMPDQFSEELKNETFVDKGFYYRHLKKFSDLFPTENIHIILYDEIKKDPKSVLKNLYKFLNVDEDFIPESFDKKINSAFSTRSKALKDLTFYIMKFIYMLKLEKLRVRIIESKTLGKIYTWMNKVPTKYPPISAEDRKKCIEIYREDIQKLEKFINKDLSSWLK